MSNSQLFDFLCHEHNFWDYDLTWNTTTPRLTKCFQETVLIPVPAIILLLAAWSQWSSQLKRPEGCSSRIFLTTLRTVLLAMCSVLNLVYLCLTPRLFIPPTHPVFIIHIISSALKIISFGVFVFLAYSLRLKTNSSLVWLAVFAELFTSLVIFYHFLFDYSEIVGNGILEYGLYVSVLLATFILFSYINEENTFNEEQEKKVQKAKPSPKFNASYPNKLFMWWIAKFIWLGTKQTLTQSDLYDLEDKLKTKPMCEKLEVLLDEEGRSKGSRKSQPNERSNHEITRVKRVNILLITLKLLFGKITISTVIRLVADLGLLCTPVFVTSIVTFVHSPSEPLWHGIFFAVSLFLTSALTPLMRAHAIVMQRLIGVQFAAALNASVFLKAMRIDQASWKTTTTGKIINLMSVDTQKVADMLETINVLITMPFMVGIAIYLIYAEMGSAAYYGLGAILITLQVNFMVIRTMKQRQIKKMEQSDRRVKFINEIFNGIRIVKLYAWEESLFDYVGEMRSKELAFLKSLVIIDSLRAFLFTVSPLLIGIAILGAHVIIQGETLNAEKIFLTLTTIESIRPTLQRFVMSMQQYTSASVSCKRLNNFFSLSDIKPYVTRKPNENAISIDQGFFIWARANEEKGASPSPKSSNENGNQAKFTKEGYKVDIGQLEMIEKPSSEPFQLSNIDLTIPKGSIIAVIGPVGSGKSSLLQAILGEMIGLQGSVNIDGSIAYVSQVSWIQNMTVRENILFGKPYDSRKYHRIIKACALKSDFEMLPAGDHTEIGERGINLSGGQKQRVSLARAVYNNADIYLFDDPLSAVDAHVSSHLFDQVLSSEMGILKEKTRILVTNKLDILPRVDKVIVIDDGKIIEAGTYRDLIASSGNLAKLAEKFSLKDIDDPEEKRDEKSEDGGKVTKKLSVKQSLSLNTEETKENLIYQENIESGSVKWSTYWNYLSQMPQWLPVVVVFSSIVVITTTVYSNIWLADWSEEPTDSQENGLGISSTQRFVVYTSLVLFNAIGTFLTLGGIALGCLSSCRALHEWLLRSVLASGVAFFDTTPTGRILNRFSRDTDSTDQILQRNLSSIMNMICYVISALIGIGIQAPLFLVFMIPIAAIYGIFPKLYLPASRQLKRLESVARSPIYSYFGESLAGLTTIKAYQVTNRFAHELLRRIDESVKAIYLSNMTMCWRILAISMISSTIIFAAAIFGVLSRSTMSPGDIGLVLTYSLRATQVFSMIVQQMADLEVNIVSVERIIEYCHLPSEGERFDGKASPGPSWPNTGKIDFENYSTRYRPGLDLVLSDIKANIRAGEKIGLIGRTGAGKSSITLALFRLIEPVRGSIYIDGLNITDIGLKRLRSKLCIIPQDPVIFSGSLRFNLDPLSCYSDHDIWRALELSHMKSFFVESGQGLDFIVSESGQNLSVGQRQLLCLTRALLKKSKILVLDEATAAIDMESDALLQETIRSEFADCTVLTIAHRLNTILDSDRIMVLDRGKIAEFAPPEILLKDETSLFYSLSKEANIPSPS